MNNMKKILLLCGIFILVTLFILFILFSSFSIYTNLPKNNNFKEIVIENMGNMDVSLSADKYDNFCEVNRGNGKKLEESCNNLTKENCNKVSCCVHINGSKCVAGSKNGATYRTEKNGDKISVDYYYYKNKCAGNCPK